MIGRRDLLALSAGLIGTTVLPGVTRAPVTAGRLRQSVSRWPFAQIPLRDFCRAAKAMGLAGIDLLQPAEWDIVPQLHFAFGAQAEAPVEKWTRFGDSST